MLDLTPKGSMPSGNEQVMLRELQPIEIGYIRTIFIYE